ncbi:MAG: hypothetical protein IZT55_03660 [Anaerolineae bacterium]|nr:hypothetical protein [Anaerolineae bacterium]
MPGQQNKNAVPHPTHSGASRPFVVTLLIAEVLIFTVLNGFRSFEAFRSWDFLSSLSMSVTPSYLAFSGLFWTLIGSILTWMLWRGHSISPQLLRICVVIYGLYYWTDRWLLTVSNLTERWPFALFMTIIGLLFPYVTLTRAKVSAYFTRRLQ